MQEMTLDLSHNNPIHIPVPAGYRRALYERLMQSPQKNICAAMQYVPSRLFFVRLNSDQSFTISIADPAYWPIYQRVTAATLEEALYRVSVPGGFAYEFCPMTFWQEAPSPRKGERAMVSLAALRPGSLFVAGSIVAIKSAYHYTARPWQCLCIGLFSGEHMHFSDGNLTRVQAIAASGVPARTSTSLGELRPGTLFLAMGGTSAVKSAYRLGSDPHAQCILLGDGSYVSFPQQDQTLVREIPFE